MMDKEREDDQVMEHERSEVLTVRTELNDILEEVAIDCQDTPEGSRLVLNKD